LAGVASPLDRVWPSPISSSASLQTYAVRRHTVQTVRVVEHGDLAPFRRLAHQERSACRSSPCISCPGREQLVVDPALEQGLSPASTALPFMSSMPWPAWTLMRSRGRSALMVNVTTVPLSVAAAAVGGSSPGAFELRTPIYPGTGDPWAWRPWMGRRHCEQWPTSDVEAAHHGAHRGKVFLTLRRRAGHFDRAAAVRTPRQRRRRQGLVNVRRARPASLPAITRTGPSAETTAATLRPLLGERCGLPGVPHGARSPTVVSGAHSRAPAARSGAASRCSGAAGGHSHGARPCGAPDRHGVSRPPGPVAR